MSLFSYEAYDKEGAIVKADFEAQSTEEVVEFLAKRGLSPISVKRIGLADKAGALSFSFFESITPVDVVFLVRNLGITMKAGLSMIEALDILIADTDKNILKNVLRTAQSNLKNGQSLSDSFASNKKYFPPAFLGMLKAGEFSGELDKSLEELGKYLTKEYALVRKVKSALTYPVILLIAAFLVVGLLLIFVLPRLTQVFSSSGVELPLITRIFVNMGSFLSQNKILDLIALAGLIWFLTGFRKTEPGKKFFYFIFSHVPVSRELIRRVLLVRFARTFGNLIGSGISIVEALELSAETVNNHMYKKVLMDAEEGVKNGVALSKTLTRYPDLFPNIFTSLIVVGEKTGTLGKVLLEFADFYEEDVDNKLRDLTSLLEPLLLLFMGVFVGAIAFSILLPIYQLVGKFT